MLRRSFSKMPNLLKSFKIHIEKYTLSVKEFFTSFFDSLVKLKYKLKNLSESNLDLGVYHLRCRNYNDAIFRFKLVDRFLDKNNKLANYWLGWTYFMKQDFKKAMSHLSVAQESDEMGLLPFIRSIDSNENVDSIPAEIYSTYRDIIAETFVDKFSSDEEDLVAELVSSFNFYAQSLPEKYTILELGANIGLLSNEINTRMQESFTLTVVESSNKMIELQQIYYPDTKLHNSIVNSSVEQFLNNTNDKYDVIYSLDGFSNKANLENIMTNIFSALNDGGYFAFAARVSEEIYLRFDSLTFSYNQDYIKTILSQTGFTILYIEEISLEIKNKYSIFVCTK